MMKEELGINEWLELIKEDKNLNGAYISISQYIYLIEKENQEFKKQVEEINRFKFSCKKDETRIPTTIYNKKTIEDISKTKSQQKKFIKYLEDEINKEKDDLEKLCELYKIPKENNNAYKFAYSYINKMEEVLQKYKEIIGYKDE